MTDLQAALVARPFVDMGRWVAFCPGEFCAGAEHFGMLPPFGAAGPLRLGGLGLGAFVCVQTCGRSFGVDWPSLDFRAGVDRILHLRPDPARRNWRPPETLHDLIGENLAYGWPVGEHDPIEEGKLIEVHGDVVTVGGLAVYGHGRLTELAARGV